MTVRKVKIRATEITASTMSELLRGIETWCELHGTDIIDEILIGSWHNDITIEDGFYATIYC